MATSKSAYEEEMKKLANEKVSSKQQAYITNEQAKLYANNTLQKNGYAEQGISANQNMAYQNSLLNNLSKTDTDYRTGVKNAKESYSSALQSELQSKIANGTTTDYQTHLNDILSQNDVDDNTKLELQNIVDSSRQASDINTTVAQLNELKNAASSADMKSEYTQAIADLLSNKEGYVYQDQVDKIINSLAEKEALNLNKADGATSGVMEIGKTKVEDFGKFKGTGNGRTQDKFVESMINVARQGLFPEGITIDMNVGKGNATYTVKNGKWVYLGDISGDYGYSNIINLASLIGKNNPNLSSKQIRELLPTMF